MKKLMFAVAPVLGALLVAGSQSGSPSSAITADPAQELPEKTTQILELDQPVDIVDATRVASGLDETITAYRFDNGNVVGEYVPTDDFPAEEFVAKFASYYGTRPAFVGIVVEKDVPKNSQRMRSGPAPSPIVTDAAPIDVLPASGGEVGSQMAEIENHAMQEVEGASVLRNSRAATDVERWAPQDIEIQAYADVTNGSKPTFQHAGWWIDPLGNNTKQMPAGWGMEIEVNLSNGDEGGSRPYCAGGYKENNWAVNYGWSWSLMTGFGGNAGAVGAYADYNDLSDPCGKNSIAIGMRWPQNLAYNYGAQTYLVQVIAPRGNRSYAYVSANFQAVSDLGCQMAPWMAYTDCMGTVSPTWPGPGDTNVTTLNAKRNWTVPNACWRSQNYGRTAPEPLTWCPFH